VQTGGAGFRCEALRRLRLEQGGARCGSTAVLSPRLADQVKSADDHCGCVENKV